MKSRDNQLHWKLACYCDKELYDVVVEMVCKHNKSLSETVRRLIIKGVKKDED